MAATQWLERTLDDSANKRLAVPDAYMATDAILVLAANVAGGLGANEGVVAANLDVHLPFIGDGGRELGRVGDRQDVHERIESCPTGDKYPCVEEASVAVGGRLAGADQLRVLPPPGGRASPAAVTPGTGASACGAPTPRTTRS